MNMASFDKDNKDTLAPKPIATAPPPLGAGERFFNDDEEEEDSSESESEGEEEDDDLQRKMKLNPDRESLSASETFAAAAASSSSGYENALVIASRQHTFNPLHDDPTYWHLLRSHFSDPITGALMDDAMILPCGHSYGRGGMQQVHTMKACCKCSHPISEDLVRPNFALRSAVQAFLHEEEIHLWKVSKRRKDRLEQDKCGYDDPLSNELLRNRASQFPLAISDRVIIKGNKRTPPRFVGRVAAVTAQCLNGWYVVKTLDNGESIKLQFGSLAKVSADQPINAVPTYPNWL